ncbi:MAG: sigma-70 family RNA polymerase sigma factor [Acidimicrobiales bacterium]
MHHETQLPPLEFDAPNDDFDAFFLSSYDRLTRSLAAAFGDRELAGEAVQEAFVRAYTRWRRVRRLDNPAAWVRRVAINLLRDQHRRRGRRDRAIARLAAMTPTHTLDDDHAAEEGGVLGHLQSLPPQQRLAVALFYLEDASIADVAHAMSISEGAVKYHLNQGRTALRKAMSLSEPER